jgi:glycosyltransferase involved in cell wall biosynthesis
VKVLHIIPSLKAGGAEKLLTDLIVSMINLGFEVEVMLLNKNDAVFLKFLQDHNVNVTFSRIKNLYSFRQIKEIRSAVQKSAPDVIHTHLFPAQFWAASALSHLNTTLITTEHSTYNRRRKLPIFKIIDRKMYRRYCCVICNSQGTKNNLEKWLPELRLKTTLISNGIITENYATAEPYQREELLQENAKGLRLLVKVSNFSKAKDHSTVIYSVAALPERYHLLLVGKGPKEIEIKRLAESLGIANRVHFLGVRQDVARILRTADILVQSSYWEGFGLAAVEGMAAGLPVLISRVPGITDVLKDDALTFPQGNAQVLADMILSLENPSFYEMQKEKSLRASKRFDLSKTVFEYLKVYTRLSGLHEELKR